MVFFSLVCFWFLFCFWDSWLPTFLSTRDCVCFVEVGLVVLSVDEPSLSRSGVFLVEPAMDLVELEAFEVVLSLLS